MECGTRRQEGEGGRDEGADGVSGVDLASCRHLPRSITTHMPHTITMSVVKNISQN